MYKLEWQFLEIIPANLLHIYRIDHKFYQKNKNQIGIAQIKDERKENKACNNSF